MIFQTLRFLVLVVASAILLGGTLIIVQMISGLSLLRRKAPPYFRNHAN
jgi:hypothetical protein